MHTSHAHRTHLGEYITKEMHPPGNYFTDSEA